jgi:hypothetical protein
MHPELKRIDPNENSDWEAFWSTSRPDALDDAGWFTVEIGPDDGTDDGEMFQVFIVTAAAVSRVKPSPRGEFRYLVVASFDAETIVSTLRKSLAGISAHSWAEIVERLVRSMHWEWDPTPRPKRKR